MTHGSEWRLTMGANLTPDGTRFRVWAPNAALVDVAVDGANGPTYHPLDRGADGVHAGLVPGVGAGTRYRYRLDGDGAYPDPYARFQPEGPHGPSAVVDPTFAWTDAGWPGLTPKGLVLYECHVGAMTPAGTFAALIGELPELRRLGVTAIELMPVATGPGRRNWGYDGVDLFAPSPVYGRPEELKRLVDEAHRLGLGVLLDVVYNHLGPDGNVLRVFADDYFTDRHKTPWGDALNFDGPNGRFVRDLVIDNACYWLAEYHLDGLRLDATDAIVDDSPTHLLAELTERARAATSRSVVLIVEEARNEVRTIRPREVGGYGLDYQGQPSRTDGTPRGTRVTDEPASAFVFCLQNHDQVGNRAYGERLHHDIDAGRYAVASALLLLAPQTPLLFMGQEFAASASFLFFTDHEPELGHKVTAGRREEFKGFRAFADPHLRETIPDPQAEETFLRSRLELRERRANAGIYRLYHDLLALRRDDPVLAVQDRAAMRVEVVGAQTLAMHRWHGGPEGSREHRLLVANFGPSLGMDPADPTLGGLPSTGARLLLSTAARRYGGTGARAGLLGQGRGRRLEVPARTAVLFGWAGAVGLA